MNENQHIPSGYKPSPLGPIPEDWEVKRIGDFGKVITGNTPPTEDTDNYGDAYKFVSPADISNSKYIVATEKHLSEKGFSISRQMPKGTVLFTCIGSTIGKCAIANESLTSNQQINAIICDSKHSGEFLYYELSHRSNRIKQIAGEQAVPIINKSTFENYKILCPPFEEQKSIAKILSLWDTAIAKQTTLIEQLTLRKRGLMQQLLTGKKRLKGFGGEWKKVRLGDVFDERNETNCNNLPLLSITGDKGVIYQSESDKRDISNEDKSKYKRICPNDIGYNTMRMWQGRSALSELEGIVSPAYTIVTPKESIDVRFMAMLVQQPRIVYSFWTHSQGLVSDTLNCKYPDFSQVKVTIPHKDEQTAIAEFFIGLNKEIELANKKLAKLQEEKKGLMQVLLTGKKRIVNHKNNNYDG